MIKIQTTILILCVALIALGSQCDRTEVEDASSIDPFVGSEKCQSCHSKEFEAWENSHHFHAMEYPSEQSILGDFSGVSFVADGDSNFFWKSDSNYYVAYQSEHGKLDTFKVVHSFGWTPLQQYLVEFDGGRFQVLRASWDVKEKRWFNQRSGERLNESDFLHWKGQSMTWNTMCADCHSTGVVKNYNIEANEFTTTFKEENVGCEGCHGPGRDHVISAEHGEPNVGMLRLQAGQDSGHQVDECGACHARRTSLNQDHMRTRGFHDGYRPEGIAAGRYFRDGQILDEDFVYGSFVQSRMYHNDVKCTDCHNPHTNALKFEGNKLCLQCHEQRYDDQEHHFHNELSEGASCINCHMPGKTYMGNDYRRDHSFRIPRPDQSVKYDVPNACTSCHDNESNDWAANRIIEWYGPERDWHYSDALLAAYHGDQNAIPDLKRIARSDSISGIIRSAAITYLMQFDDTELLSVIQEVLNDSDPWLRTTVLEELSIAPLELRVRVGLPMMADPIRSVRLAAYNLTSDIPTSDVPESYRTNYELVRREFKDYLDYNSDFREGRLQSGLWARRQGRFDLAVSHFQQAIRFDPDFIEVYQAWASTESNAGNQARAEKVLKVALEREPSNARTHYLLGLLYHESGMSEKGLSEMEEAMRLSPSNADFAYNAVMLTERTKSREEAIVLLRSLPSDIQANPRILSLNDYYQL